MTPLDHALAYHARGWSTVPVGKDKKSFVKWEQWQHELPPEPAICEWWKHRPNAGIGIILGHVSGNLAVRDFDDPESYRRWREMNPDLATTLPTVETARGYHVYFTANVAKSVEFDDGELRGEGAYVVAPPSIHKDGAAYTWIIPPNGRVPKADPALFSARAFATDSVTELTEQTEGNQRQWAANSRESPPENLEDALTWSQPTGPGLRHHCIFDFARMLKALPEYADRQAADLLETFVVWWDHAEPNTSGDHDLAESFTEFEIAWANVQVPWGESLNMAAVIEMARQLEPLERLVAFRSEPLISLANVCCVLQKNTGDQPFWLSTRDAGKVIGSDQMKAWRYLKRLENEGVIECIERGTRGTSGKATRYRYVG